MNGILLLVPFFLIRFVLCACLNKAALQRAAHFAPLQGMEVQVYWIYQVSNVAIFVYLCFLSVKIEESWICSMGLFFYLLGACLCAITIFNFARPSKEGINTNGLYCFSRNPMYVSYFIFFVGCVGLTQSWVLCVLVVVFQFTAHWIILSEERWCLECFPHSYAQYKKQVRRYL